MFTLKVSKKSSTKTATGDYAQGLIVTTADRSRGREMDIGRDISGDVPTDGASRNSATAPRSSRWQRHAAGTASTWNALPYLPAALQRAAAAVRAGKQTLVNAVCSLWKKGGGFAPC
jgi:hypothetical protein